MVVEVHEKIRSKIRAIKILLDLLELGHIFYIIRIVIKNATSFMLQDFVFVQRIESSRFEHRARAKEQGQGWSGVLGLAPWACFFLHLPFTFCTPLAHFLHFCIFHFFYIFWLYLFFLNIEKSQKYFLNFLHFILLFLLFLDIKIVY